MILDRLRSRAQHRGDALRAAFEAGALRQAARLATRALGRPLPEPQPDRLLDWQRRVLGCIQQRLCAYAAVEGLPPADALEGALDATLAFWRGFPPPVRGQLSDLLAVFEAQPLLRPGGAPFSDLPGEEQDRWLERWEQSQLVLQYGAFRGLKSICMMGYWSQPGSWGAIGYSLSRNRGFPRQDTP